MPILQRRKQRLREVRPSMYLPAGVLGLEFTQTAGGCSLPAHLPLWLGMQRWMPCFCTLSYCFPELEHQAHLWKSQGLPGQEGRLPGIITASHVNSILSHSPCLSPEEEPGPGSGTFSHYWLQDDKLFPEVVNSPFLRVCKPELGAVWAWTITVEIAALH